MIQSVGASLTAADFKLPEAVSTPDPTIEAFGNVYAANRSQFATRETADALASFLGGKVTDLSEDWGLGHISPLYQIDFGNGKSLNAGLLADRFQRYGNATAMQMTQDELGFTLTPKLATTAAPAAHTAADAVTPSYTNVTTEARTANADTTAKPASDVESAKLADAARQFESLLMAQILKSAAPQEEDGLLSGTGDSSSQSIYQLALENFAAVLGQSGGMGLAESVTDHIRSGSTTSIRG